MPQKKRPPTDHTGAKREQLEREHADEIKRRSAEMGMAARVQAEASNEVVDLTQQQPLEELFAEGETTTDVVEQPWETVGEVPEPRTGPDGTMVLRVNCDLEDVTIGAGNNYTFMEGQAYRVPRHVYDHLEEKGYVWH